MYVLCCYSNESERVTRKGEKGNAMLDDVALMDVVKESYVIVKSFLILSTACFYYLLGHGP